MFTYLERGVTTSKVGVAYSNKHHDNERCTITVVCVCVYVGGGGRGLFRVVAAQALRTRYL